jgi:Laminin G domain
MRFVLFLLPLLLFSPPAFAQFVVPLTTPDGRVGCTQGMTGIGRPAAWEAVADPDGPNGWALVETAADATDLRFPLCVYEQATARDFDATLRFKPISGTREQVAGFIFRAQSANDYYVVRANARDDSVRLYRMEKGKRSQLASKEAPLDAGQWHSLRVIVVNDRFEVSLDGKQLFSTTDRSLIQAGPMGVWSQADSVTHYGSLLVGPPMR